MNENTENVENRTKYGKIVCGVLVVPQNYPNSIVVDGEVIMNPTDEQMLAAGYLPIVETEPEHIEGKEAVAHYHVSDDGTCIIQTWEYVDPAPPVEPEEQPTQTSRSRRR